MCLDAGKLPERLHYIIFLILLKIALSISEGLVQANLFEIQILKWLQMASLGAMKILVYSRSCITLFSLDLWDKSEACACVD